MNIQQIQDLINNNGIRFHEDAGHGWLQVSRSLIRKLGVKPTRFSYVDKDYAYLEEDCDITKFIDAAGLRPYVSTFTGLCPRTYTEDSPIRKKERF